MDHGLRIGEVARGAGVNIQTLRFYERRGLLDEPPRGTSGYREYPEESVRLVRFIKRAQGLGFSLREVEELLTLRESRGRCSDVRTAALTKLEDVRQKIRSLEAMHHALAALVKACGRGRIGPCPILDALDDAEGSVHS